MTRDDYLTVLSTYAFRCGLVVLMIIIGISSLPARAIPSQVIADSGLKAPPPPECPAQYPSPIGFLKLPFMDPDVILFQGFEYNPRFSGTNHFGIDYEKQDRNNGTIRVPFDVRASYGGKATYYVGHITFGNHVRINHKIEGRNFTTIYAHLESSVLEPNQTADVEQGAIIGQAGTTGRSSHIHLHFELWEERITPEIGRAHV